MGFLITGYFQIHDNTADKSGWRNCFWIEAGIWGVSFLAILFGCKSLYPYHIILNI